jgi:hypothetical protein
MIPNPRSVTEDLMNGAVRTLTAVADLLPRSARTSVEGRPQPPCGSARAAQTVTIALIFRFPIPALTFGLASISL